MSTIAGNGATDRVSATLDPAVLAELIRLAISLRYQTPTDVAPADALQSRRDFLRESLGETREADTVFERIIRGDELCDEHVAVEMRVGATLRPARPSRGRRANGRS
jgi:hypothetical protein